MIRKISLLIGAANAASSGVIEIDVRGTTDYYGPLMVGSDQLMNHMIYDTMSDWTVILDAEAENQQIINNYDVSSSTSANVKDKEVSVDYGSFSFSGIEVNDQFCLKKSNFCLKDFKFLAAKTMVGSFSANGVLGLAPTLDSRSFMKALKD